MFWSTKMAFCISIVAIALSKFGCAQTQSPTIYSYSIGYFPNGNVASISDNVNGQWTDLNYDSLNRLISGTLARDTQPKQYFCWAYDSFGNRKVQQSSDLPFAVASGTDCQVVGSLLSNIYTTPNSSNQIQITNAVGVAASPLYDNAGNQTTDGKNQFAYDAENRICAVLSESGTLTQYIYNAEGQRVAKGHSSSGNTLACPIYGDFAVDQKYILGQAGEQVTELNSSDQWTHSNAWVNGQLLATYDAQGLHFSITDTLGTKRVQASFAGAAELRYTSLPFGDGAQMDGFGVDATEHRFTGKERDTESGNDYFGARYYASAMGRFMSPDDGSDQDPSDPQSWNLYGYVRNNPLRNTDPTGNACVNGVDDDRGGETCAQVAAADAAYQRQGKASVTVTAQPGNTFVSLLLNSAMALNNMANDYFAGITGLHATSNLQLSSDWTGTASNVGVQIAGALIGPAGEARGAINITEKGLQHVLERHAVGGAKAAGKSLFNAGTDIKALIKGAESSIPEKLPNGDLRFTVDAGQTVGIDRSTGAATSKYTVVTDSSRNLITAHPGAYK